MPDSTYPQRLLFRKHLAEQPACADAQCVAEHVHLLDIVHGAEIGDERLQLLSRVQLQAPPLEGEDLGRRSHFDGNEAICSVVAGTRSRTVCDNERGQSWVLQDGAQDSRLIYCYGGGGVNRNQTLQVLG